jgi:hypothetical protein
MTIAAMEADRENQFDQAKKLLELERRVAKLEKAS